MLRWLQAKPSTQGVPLHPFQGTIVGSYGALYGVVSLILTVAAIAGLIARYRKVGVA